MTNDPEKVYTTDEVANILKVDASITVRRWIKSGKIKAFKVSGEWRVKHSELLRVMDDRGEE